MDGGLPGWTRPDQGVLFVLTGPSGVGKSTLIHAALARIPDLAFSVSATTRSPRPGERDGVDYHFIGRARFDELLRQGAFLEHATVYDHSYGTLRAPVREAIDQGRSILLDIDLLGARQVRSTWPGAVHVMVLPPDVATLEARLRARGTDGDEVIAARMAQVAGQLVGVGEYDYLVVNDELSTAQRVLEGVLLAELSRRQRREGLVRAVLGQIGH